MNKIEIKNLSMVFGKNKEVSSAVELANQGLHPDDIRKKTNATVALNKVSLNILDTELFVIVGLSGSGKSTLIRCLNLLNNPTSGSIKIDGKDISKLSKIKLREFRRKKVSMVFQHFGLLNHRSVIKNVEYGLEVQGVNKEMRRQKAIEAIKLVGLEGWENHRPSQLSGGMKQRVGIARALTTEPEILLMDEPYGALDPLIRREMQNELLNLEDYINRTIVFITHDMNEAFKMGDRIALMKDGEVVQLGTPRDFFESPANDYVKSFIADVDKTRVLKVRTIMRKPDFVTLETDSSQNVLKTINKNNLDFCYVVDDNNVLKGYVRKEDLEKADDIKIADLVIKEKSPVYRNEFLKDIWEAFEEAEYDVPIIDSKNRLRGVVSKEDIIKALG